MKKSITIVTLAAALSACCVPVVGQTIYKVNTKMNLTGVNNDGVVVGYPDLNTPYYLWRAVEKGPNQSAEDLELIGGMGPGDGIGGHGRFSDDGKIISAVTLADVLVRKGWTKTIDMPTVQIKDMYVPIWDVYFFGLAVGVDTETGNSVVLKTGNEGEVWKIYDNSCIQNGLKQGAINTFSVFCSGSFLLGGDNGLFYQGKLGNQWLNEVDPRPEGLTKNVKSYHAINFIDAAPYCGVIAVEYEDGTAGVWQCDNGESVSTTDISFTDVTEGVKGLTGMPMSIVNDGTNFYMATNDGNVYKSTDNGKTWESIYYAGSNVKFTKIAVSGEGKLAAVCGNGNVYICTDGSSYWERRRVDDGSGDYKWYTVAFDGEKLVVAGADGQIYSSEDYGETWVNEGEDLGVSSDIYAINQTSTALMVGGTDGCLMRKPVAETKNGAISSLYDMETQEWTPLKSTGYVNDISIGSPYDISGDGKYVVGLAPWKESDGGFRSHATVWSTETGVPVDLGTRVEGRATRANGASYDGSVVVGWQDFHGPWYASVWRKGADGYTQEFIYSHEGVSEEDLDFNDNNNLMQNLALELRSVSSDGKWLGGRGGELSLIKNPYIYSIETGIVELTDNGVGGTVSDINNEGDIAIGWYGTGESGWIWTKEDGIMDINDFARNVLGAEYTGTLCSAYDMSPNGRFVIGYGMEGTQDFFGYMLDLKQWLEDREQGTGIADVTVYPNPATDELHIDMLSDGNAHVNLYNLTGRKVYSSKVTDTSNVVNISSVKNGIYVLEVQAGNARKTMKFQVKH